MKNSNIAFHTAVLLLFSYCFFKTLS